MTASANPAAFSSLSCDGDVSKLLVWLDLIFATSTCSGSPALCKSRTSLLVNCAETDAAGDGAVTVPSGCNCVAICWACATCSGEEPPSSKFKHSTNPRASDVPARATRHHSLPETETCR